MNLNDLLEMLELSEPSEFRYFENFADIVESEEEISEDALAELFDETDSEEVAEIIENYFEDMTAVLKEDYPDIGGLLNTIRNVLITLITDETDEGSVMRFAEELDRFKNWYCFDSSVALRNIVTNDEFNMPVRDALTQMRIEKLDDSENVYDFTDALDYEIDEYLLDMVGNSRDYEFEDPSDNILNYGFGYDDEMK